MSGMMSCMATVCFEVPLQGLSRLSVSSSAEALKAPAAAAAAGWLTAVVCVVLGVLPGCCQIAELLLCLYKVS